jgi:hypothetical protein
MLRREPTPSTPTGQVSDLELGLAAVLVGVLVILTTILVPLIG